MGISSPSSDGKTDSEGVDAIDDGKLERGLGLGDLERFSKKANL
jgi:hypothetical protein